MKMRRFISIDVMFENYMNKKTKDSALIVGSIICSAFVVIAEGVKPNVFTVWNLFPILICYFVLKMATSNGSRASLWGSIGLTFSGIGMLLFVHAAWLFDWGGTKTSSSTSGLIFIFLPVYSLGTAGVGYLGGWLLVKLISIKT